VVDDVLFQVTIGQRKAAALRLVALRADGIMGRGHLSQHKEKKIDDGQRKRKQQADLTLRPEIGNWEEGNKIAFLFIQISFQMHLKIYIWIYFFSNKTRHHKNKYAAA